MAKKDVFMYVPQQLVRDQGCTHMDVAVWCYTFIEIYNDYKSKSMVCASQIAYQIKENYVYTQNFVSEIADSIRNLIESGYLTGGRCGKGHYEIATSSFDPSNYDHYIKIRIDDIRRIIKENTRPFATLRYYLLILSTINASTKCAYWSIESLADILGNDATIITRYLSILEKMSLIYVYRGVGATNTYGRFEDKETIIMQGQARGNDGRVTKASNIKRRMTQMYNRVKAGHTYDPVIMEEIRDYCQRKNDETGENFYDLSVFKVDFARDAS